MNLHKGTANKSFPSVASSVPIKAAAMLPNIKTEMARLLSSGDSTCSTAANRNWCKGSDGHARH